MWLTGWKYRKKITLTGQTGAGTNYQVKLLIGESSGATGANFNVGGNSLAFPSSKNDSGDLRFTASDGVTELSFWVESVSGTNPNRTATIWVKVSADLGSNQDIYCYYGGTTTNVSNGDDTFEFFDDFEGSSLDTTKWYVKEATLPTIANSEMRYNHTNSTYGSIYAKYNITKKHSLMIKACNLARTTAGTHYFGGLYGKWNGSVIDEATNNYICYRSEWSRNSGNGDWFFRKNGSNSNVNQSGYVNTGASDWEYKIKSNNDVQVLRNGTQIRLETGFTDFENSTCFRMYGAYKTGDVYADTVIVRKLNDTEPSYNTAGSEEEETPSGTMIKRWNGTAWEEKPLKRYNGSEWENITIKRYNGSSWDEL